LDSKFAYATNGKEIVEFDYFTGVESAQHAYAWVVQDFFASAPSQFIYGLASFLAGVDVIRPFGSLE
jgi:hypothetical protein